MKAKKRAIIFGASGFVGIACLKELLNTETYQYVTAFTRSPLNFTHSKLDNIVVDFTSFTNFKTQIIGDDLFFCLGTPLSKIKSYKQFINVNFHLPLKIAKIAKNNDIKKFLMVTSFGASKNSWYFPLKVKGKLEEEISKLYFDEIHFFRPSMILGHYDHERTLERMISSLLPMIRCFLPKSLAPIEVEMLAARMIHSASGNYPGLNIHKT